MRDTYLIIKSVVHDGEEPDEMNEFLDLVGPFTRDEASRFSNLPAFADREEYPRIISRTPMHPTQALIEATGNEDILWIDEDPLNPTILHIEPTVDPVP